MGSRGEWRVPLPGPVYSRRYHATGKKKFGPQRQPWPLKRCLPAPLSGPDIAEPLAQQTATAARTQHSPRPDWDSFYRFTQGYSRIKADAEGSGNI
jgi:hypothetical protein